MSAMETQIQEQFPSLRQGDISYLDSAASSQTCRAALDAMGEFYTSFRANIHRGVYRWSAQATEAFEAARECVASFLNAADSREIIFTRGTTESINLVMRGLGPTWLSAGDRVVTTVMEHHSNFVPWQQYALEAGAEFVCVPLDADERFSVDAFCDAITPNTKLVAITHLANGIGLQPDLEFVVSEAKKRGALTVVDAAQSAAHCRIDVQDLQTDFLAFSGHKLYGPTGVGVLYGRYDALNQLKPVVFGGDMIERVSISGTTFAELPARLEAGTPPIAEVLGLAAAIQFLESLSWKTIQKQEQALIAQMEEELTNIPDLRVLGPRGEHHALLAFCHPRVHPHDLAQFLDMKGVAVRAGHHCAQPLLEHLGISASTRASVGVYSTEEDVSKLSAAVAAAVEYFT